MSHSVLKAMSAITLNEPAPGHCPVCREHYAADPGCHCACTRPRPGDAAEMDKAYLHSALCRRAKLATDRQIAKLYASRVRRPHSEPPGAGNVVSITKHLPRWRRRAR